MLYSMERPIYVCPLTHVERETLKAGLRSPDAFTLRRCQILLASARGEVAYQIARGLGYNPQTARNAIHEFNEKGLREALRQGLRRPHTIDRAFDLEEADAFGGCYIRIPADSARIRRPLDGRFLERDLVQP